MPSKRTKRKKPDNNRYVAFGSYAITAIIILAMVYEIMALSNSQVSTSPNILTTPELVLTALFSLFLSSIVISYMFIRGNTWNGIIESLGLDSKTFTVKLLGYGIILFLIIFVLEVVLSVVAQISGIQISTNTQLVLGGAPAWFLFFATFISPINEEIFFRGFLIKAVAHIYSGMTGTDPNFYTNNGAAWTGILIGAILFGLSHASYDSTFGVDILAAGLFAILAGYVFRKTKSLYPSMLAHMLVNLLAVLAFVA